MGTDSGVITHQFTDEEAAEMKQAAEEMRQAYERIEQKIDEQGRMLEHLVRRGNWWKKFIANVMRRLNGIIESELKEAE